MDISLIFYVIAIVLFALAGLGVTVDRINLLAFGLLFFVLGHVF